MKAKPIVMLVGAAALVGGYFFFTRRASAAEAPGPGGTKGAGAKGSTSILDQLGDFVGDVLGFGGSVGGEPGGKAFSEVTGNPRTGGAGSVITTPSAPAGTPRLGPIPFEGGAIAPKPKPVTIAKPSPAPQPIGKPPGGTILQPIKLGLPTTAPPKGRSTVQPVTPIARPTVQPKMTPLAVRAAQGTLGSSTRIAGKDARRLALV